MATRKTATRAASRSTRPASKRATARAGASAARGRGASAKKSASGAKKGARVAKKGARVAKPGKASGSRRAVAGKRTAAGAKKRAGKNSPRAVAATITSMTALERLLRRSVGRWPTEPDAMAATEALCALEGDGLALLAAYVSGERAPLRVKALHVLGKIGQQRGAALVEPALVRFLSVRRPWHEQVHALDAAWTAGATAVRPLARELLADDAGFVRAAAMRYLAHLPDADTPALLRDRLARASGSTEIVPIVYAISELGDRDAVPALVGLFDHRNRTIVCAAISALARIGDPLAEGPIASLRDAVADQTIKSFCRRALDNLRRRVKREGTPRRARGDTSERARA